MCVSKFYPLDGVGIWSVPSTVAFWYYVSMLMFVGVRIAYRRIVCLLGTLFFLNGVFVRKGAKLKKSEAKFCSQGHAEQVNQISWR